MKQKSLPSMAMCWVRVACLLSLVACGSTDKTAQAPTTQTSPASIATARPAPVIPRGNLAAALLAPNPIRFEESVSRAGLGLFTMAKSGLGDEPRQVVIDPLIDANTGAQTFGTVKMGQELEGLLKSQHPQWQIKPLTRQALAAQPLLLIGTLTPVNTERSIDKQPDAFRVWLTLIDLRTKRVVAKQLDRSTVDSVNPEPLAFFRDSPTWHKDKTVQGYINSCQVNTNVGDFANDDYLARLPSAAVVNEAMMAYNEGKVSDANRLYKEARELADEGDLRVLNGLYLTSWQLGQKNEARDAFRQLVATGLDAKRLPMKLLFRPGGTNFNEVGDLGAQYQLWLGVIAEQAGKTPACVKVVGHTSRTGSASINERLSLRRAEAVQRLIETRNRGLSTRLSAAGVGSREALIGLGSDDQRDALDRRVEFRVVDCI